MIPREVSALPDSTLTTRRAVATRKRRLAAGAYPTPAQRDAFKRMLAVGNARLTKDELQALSTHPNLTAGQRAEYAQRALQAQVDGNGCVANLPTTNGEVAA